MAKKAHTTLSGLVDEKQGLETVLIAPVPSREAVSGHGLPPVSGAIPVLLVNPLAPPAATDEEMLVQRLRDRDDRALSILHDQYAKSLLAVIRRLVRDEEQAYDILQEGLLKVWLNIGSYDASRGRFFTWMARVCSNQAIDSLRNPHYRFNCRNHSLENSGAQQVLAPTAFNPDHIGMRELLLKLKPRQREVIDLVYFGGRTQAEAAEKLGIPIPTVKTRVRAALLALARFVQ
jgi:RNA polymerase sigma factor (sigma-70 family)